MEITYGGRVFTSANLCCHIFGHIHTHPTFKPLTSRPVVISWGGFASQWTFGKAWSYFCLSQLGDGGTTGIQWIEDGDAAKHPKCTGQSVAHSFFVPVLCKCFCVSETPSPLFLLSPLSSILSFSLSLSLPISLPLYPHSHPQGLYDDITSNS